MGKVIKSTIARRPEDLFQVEAGPISIMTGSNLRTSSPMNSVKSKEKNSKDTLLKKIRL